MNLRSTALFIALVTFCASVYILTYSARIESGDSLQYFNSAGSLARYGDDFLDLSMWFAPPAFNDFASPYPLRGPSVESLSPALQPILASLLYAIADRLPGVGLVHVVWLFNVLVNALAVGVFYAYTRTLDYSMCTAVIGAVCLAFCTLLWPYSKTFFRDPLALLLVLLAALSLELWRQRGYRALGWLLIAGVFMLGALHTKTTTGLVLPAFVMLVLPSSSVLDRPRVRLALDVLLVLLLIVPALLVFIIYAQLLLHDPFAQIDLLHRFRINVSIAQTALHTYLFSVGGSIWGTSPIVMLAIPGGWFLLRAGQRRYLWVVLFILLAYTLGYSSVVNEQWFGGLSWPPRFMLPVIPFLMLATLPALERVVKGAASRWLQTVFVILIIYSLWVQFSAVSLEWGRYPEALPPEAGQLVEWGPGLNTLQYLRWIIIPGLWSQFSLDFAWVRTGAAVWALAMVAFAGLCGFIILALLRRFGRMGQQMVFVLPLIFFLLVGVGLRAFYVDDVYQGGSDSLHKMLTLIGEVTQPGDYIVLNSNEYERFFLNYARYSDRRFLTFPIQPGEQPSVEQAPLIISNNPDELLFTHTFPALLQLAARGPRLWVLMDSGPFIPWRVRPIERFMNAHYYPVREFQTDPPDPRLRLIEYVTTSAPDRYSFRGPSIMSDLTYASAVHLAGFELPLGTTYQAGAALPLSFYWKAVAPIDRDYVVAWKLVNETGFVVAEGADAQPDGGFSPTSGWQVGVPVWDNRALLLPTTLSSGEYYLWIILYERLPDGTLHNLPVEGGLILPNTDLHVLPQAIQLVTSGK